MRVIYMCALLSIIFTRRTAVNGFKGFARYTRVRVIVVKIRYVYCIASLDAVGEYWKRNYLCSVNHKNACILADAEETTKRNSYFKKRRCAWALNYCVLITPSGLSCGIGRHGDTA